MKKEDKDYYKILGVSKTSTPEEIKKAYRKKALEFHPDRNPNNKEAEELFKIASEAYETLSDPDKRAEYDEFGIRDKRRGFHDPRNVYQNFQQSYGFNDMDEIMRDFQKRFFGRDMEGFGSFGNQRRTINPDIKAICNISLKDAINGGKIRYEYTRYIVCIKCNGNGGNTKDEKCPTCDGKGGMIRQIQPNVIVKQSCPDCGGSGKVIEECSACNGEGYSAKSEEVLITIPPFVPQMATLRVQGGGNVVMVSDSNTITGNLFVVVNYANTEDGVTLHNGNLYITIRVPIDKVLSEDEIKVNVLGCKKIANMSKRSLAGRIIRKIEKIGR